MEFNYGTERGRERNPDKISFPSVTSYLEVGAGAALLSMEPGLDYKIPSGCTIEVSFAKNSTDSRGSFFESKRAQVKVRGKFIILGCTSTSGALVDADVTLLKRIGAANQ